MYIRFRLRKRIINNSDFSIGNCLFGAVEIKKALDKNGDQVYKYYGYDVCYDFNNTFSHGNNLNARNLIIFGADSSTHKTNRVNNVYMLGKAFEQGLDGTTIYADKKCLKQIHQYLIKCT